jgi:hypothetical protein
VPFEKWQTDLDFLYSQLNFLVFRQVSDAHRALLQRLLTDNIYLNVFKSNWASQANSPLQLGGSAAEPSLPNTLAAREDYLFGYWSLA